MKKQLLLFATLLVSSAIITACQTVAPLLDTTKSSLRQGTSSVKLDVDTIVQMAYPKTFSEPMAHVTPELSDYFKSYPYKQLAPNILGFFHPNIEYKNTQGETRYLVIVEKVNIYDGHIQSCRACSSTADLLIFKKQNHRFELVNSALNQTEIPTGNGHFRLGFKEELQKHLQPFGKNIMGSYMHATYTGAGGQESAAWYAVLLPDDGQIQALEIGSAGGSTASYYADRPEFASTTTSTLKVIANQNTYYPIEVTYTDQGQPQQSYKRQFVYDQTKHEYLEYPVK